MNPGSEVAEQKLPVPPGCCAQGWLRALSQGQGCHTGPGGAQATGVQLAWTVSGNLGTSVVKLRIEGVPQREIWGQMSENLGNEKVADATQVPGKGSVCSGDRG